MFKNLLSVIAGLFSGFVVVLLFETILPLLFNIKPLADTKDTKVLNEFIKSLPPGLLIANALTYGLAAFTGSYITFIISHNSKLAITTTLIFFIVVLVNFFSFQHPAWMVILGCSVTLLGGYLATKIRSSNA